MIKSAHKITVRFSPVTGNKREFSKAIMKIKGTSISGGSYASYPYVESNATDIVKAIEIERQIRATILKYGGTIFDKSSIFKGSKTILSYIEETL